MKTLFLITSIIILLLSNVSFGQYNEKPDEENNWKKVVTAIMQSRDTTEADPPTKLDWYKLSSTYIDVLHYKSDSTIVSKDNNLILFYCKDKIVVKAHNYSKFGILEFKPDFTNFTYKYEVSNDSYNGPSTGHTWEVKDGIAKMSPGPQVVERPRTNNVTVAVGPNNTLIVITDDGRVIFDPKKVRETLSFVAY